MSTELAKVEQRKARKSENMDNTSTQLDRIPEKKPPIASGSKGLQFSNLDELWRFCTAVVNSKQFGREIDTPEVALIRLQAGLELGLTPIWSLTNIFVVNGKPTVYGDALLGIVRAHPEFADIRETVQGEGDDMVAICEVDRKGQSTTARRFGVRDAKKAGLWGKTGPWTSYPQRMLQMRARAWACRDAFADALRGLGVSEEVRDIEPRSIQAHEIERPKLILPDEQPNELANTEPKRDDKLASVVESAEASEGPERVENKPLMRNRGEEEKQAETPTGSTDASTIKGEVRNEKGEFVF